MRAHVIQNGVIANTIEVDSLDVLPNLVEATEGSIGWSYADGVFTAPPSQPPTRDELKAERDAAVAAIKVTTTAGNTFDGDEVSQTRMTRAVVALGAAPAGSTVNWVLSDNSVLDATEAELTEALLLAGKAQADIWVLP